MPVMGTLLREFGRRSGESSASPVYLVDDKKVLIVRSTSRMADSETQACINQLAALFRKEQPTRPVLLLGAGASFPSGVPTASELVREIIRLGYAIEKYGDERRILHVTPTDARSFCQRQSWWHPDRVADCFPHAVQSVLTPPERRRRYLVKWTKYQRISDGYVALAKMMARRLCWTVLTTNFDTLIIDSLAQQRTQLREVVEVNRTADDLSRFNSHNRCQIVYLHGSVDYYTDCNLIDETQKLDSKLAEKIWPLLAEAPLIVCGYRGSEPSVMEHLLRKGIEKCDRFKHGIFWCYRNEPLHPLVLSLKEKLGSSFKLLKIDGFDEVFTRLEVALSGDSVMQERGESALPVSWDALPVESLSMADINLDELRATLLTYCKNIGITPPSPEFMDRQLLELQLAVRKGAKLVPTNASLLLFGRTVTEHLPHAAVSLRIGQKRQSVFSGNLVRQFSELSDALADPKFNPTIRLKGGSASTEMQAFPPLALRELIVNLLVHRDYQKPDISIVERCPGVSLEFRSPGGLPASVRHNVLVDDDGAFRPVRGQSECRNPVIADIFCGLTRMDKAGSGLPDVELELPKHGGRAEFFCEADNSCVVVRLLQAEQRDPKTTVAISKTETEVYSTNLLPLMELPIAVYRAPLLIRDSRIPLYEKDDEKDLLPLCIRAENWFYSFGDFRMTPRFASRHALLSATESIATAAFLIAPDQKRLFSWLVSRHWDMFLERFQSDGLHIDYKKDRAYFRLTAGQSNVIHYQSRLGRRVRRAVVKRRADDGSEHENEGFFYEVSRYGKKWFIQMKPTYVFTGADGLTPLPALRHSSKATRRIKFDRNKSVDDDLAFWSRYLGREISSVNLGRGFGDDFIIDLRFVEVEIPSLGRTEVDS